MQKFAKRSMLLCRLFICAMIAYAATAAAADSEVRVTISRHAALVIARTAAQEEGYDLSKYVIDPWKGGAEKTQDGKEWLFLFVCTPPERRPPGCEVLVSVNRQSGETRVMPGM